MEKIRDGSTYIESLRGRNLNVYVLGEKVEEPVDHPIVRPSINALAKTYDLALEAPELASTISPFTGEPVSRFLHICTDANDLVLQKEYQLYSYHNDLVWQRVYHAYLKDRPSVSYLFHFAVIAQILQVTLLLS